MPSRARTSKDFFSALVRDSQTQRHEVLAQRELWLRSVDAHGKEELLFEFEMLLRGLERYFNLHNLPLDVRSRPVLGRDFREELSDVRDAMHRAVRISRQLLDPVLDQRMVFRRYVESQLADDRTRRSLREEEFNPSTPEESLFLLRESFVALRNLIDELVQKDRCAFSVFSDMGQLIVREVVLNPFFRPFRSLEFRLEYDRIKSVYLLDGLRSLAVSDRPLFTMAFLALYRLLHYLSYVAPGEERRARVILALVRSEMGALVAYLKEEASAKASHKRLQTAALKSARDVAAETQRVVKRVLGPPPKAPASLLAAARAFQELCQKEICRLAEAVDPNLCGDDLFTRLGARADSAKRLRIDLWVLYEIARLTEKVLRGGTTVDQDRALGMLGGFLGYFHDVSYQLLRYEDYPPFDRLFTGFLEREGPLGLAEAQRLAEDCKAISAVAKSTFLVVNRRADLAGRRFESTEAKALLERFFHE